MHGAFGFIREKIDIKILILFIMRRMAAPIDFDQLTDLTMCDGGISYFDYAECVADLVKTEHLILKDDKYSLTAKGRRNGEATEVNLPYSVRLAVEKTTAAVRAVQNRDAMIKTTHTLNKDGSCTVALAMSDGLGEIISINLFSANEQQALALEKGFRKNAEKVFNGLLEMILEEDKSSKKEE